MRLLTTRPRLAAATFGGLLVSLSSAFAAAVPDSSSGIFQNPLPPEAEDEITNLANGDAHYEWGTVEPSSFDFFHLDSIAAGGSFSVGEFQYFNGESTFGTGAESVEFKLTVNFSLDPGPGTASQDMTFLLKIDNSLNVPDPVASADSVLIDNPTHFFTIDGVNYSLTLAFDPTSADGFIQGGNDKRFYVLEGGTGVADLRATFSVVTGPVPEAGATLVMLGSGIACLGLLRRTKVGSVK
jgi:hypothetical protein